MRRAVTLKAASRRPVGGVGDAFGAAEGPAVANGSGGAEGSGSVVGTANGDWGMFCAEDGA
ncbi:MAG: hypothetical protein WAN59_13980 [Candidatus Baltobacteraceae bacterium]